MRERLSRALLALVVVAAFFVGLMQLAWHARIFAGRATFPLDLEWMEGGVLMHAHRLMFNKGIYTAPSVDFIPFFYTPLYPAVLAALGKVFGLGYTLGRLVSLLAFFGTLGLLIRASAAEAKGRARWAALAVGITGAGVVVAGFEFSGTFYDLVRADSLLLLLEALTVWLAVSGTSRKTAAAAGICIALAFFTKQVASIVGVGVGLGLLVAHWRRGLIYGVAAAATLGAGLAILQRTSQGWFWKYVFEGHQSHHFNWTLALQETPRRILKHEGWALGALLLATLALALGRKLRRTDLIWWMGAVAGVIAAAVGFGTQWAFENAFIPAVYFPILAATVLTARLVGHAFDESRLGATMAALLCAGALGATALLVKRPDQAQWVPSARDRGTAEKFLAELRSFPGPLFIPFHPFYGVLAGKQPFLHRMGWMDVASFAGRPKGLDEAIAGQRFSHVVLDYKYQDHELPGLESRYHTIRTFTEGADVVRVPSGASTWPNRLLIPSLDPPALPALGHRVFDFESGSWTGWQVEGVAFGATPAPARDGMFGRAAADTFAGPAKTGRLVSTPFTIDRNHLRFSLRGGPAEGLRVMLLDGPETAHTAIPTGPALQTVDWDVTSLQGRKVVLVIEDQSSSGSLAVDDVALF